MSALPVELGLRIEAGDWSCLGDMEALASSAVEAALQVAADAPRDGVEVSLLLTDDAGMQRLNRVWRGKDRPTNVLSFPAPARPGMLGPRALGDLALAFETLRREAEADGKALVDHLSHLIVHGTLHLLGYNHMSPGEAEVMEALEVRALRLLGIADPYEGTVVS